MVEHVVERPAVAVAYPMLWLFVVLTMGCFVKLPDFGVVKPFQEWPVEEPRMRDGEEEKKVGAATPATVTLAKVTFKLAAFVAEAPPGRPEGGDMSVAYMLSVELARGNSQGIPAESAPCSTLGCGS